VGDRQPQAQDVARRSAIHEREISRVGLDLSPEVGPAVGDVQVVLEGLDRESLAQEPFGLRKLLDGNGEIEVEAHHGLGVRVDGLSVHDAEADPMLGQERHEPIEEIGPVEGRGLPERSGLHGGFTPLAIISMQGSSQRVITQSAARIGDVSDLRRFEGGGFELRCHEMSQVRPVVSAMLLCDIAIREEGTRRVSLIRLFDSILAQRLPLARGPFYVYALLTDAEGRYDVEIELRRLEDLAAIGDRQSLPVVLHDRHAFGEFVFEVEEMILERPGRYEFRLYANDRVLGVKSFSVVQSFEGLGGQR